ncbi:MAG: helicase HerA-like domain-containing protein [Candidatus Diapherotrites archaeon]
MAKEKVVESRLEKEMGDEFDEIFGLEEDKKKARERIKKLVEEEKEKAAKKESLPEENKKKPEKEPVIEKSAETTKQPEKTKKAKEEKKIEPKKAKQTEVEAKESEKDSKEKPKTEKKQEPKKPSSKKAKEVLEEDDLSDGGSQDFFEESKGEPSKSAFAEIVEPAADTIYPPLSFLNDGKKSVLIGRKKSVFEKYGFEGALHIGRIAEQEFSGNEVFLDSLNPHVVFVCGARGSGKSYALGIMAEELALKNKNVGIIVIDPVGVFWSMRFPNREEKEIESLKEWGLKPKGLENLMVFIPKGMEKETPRETYDATFSIRPSLLTATDWCLTFGIDKFSPTGLLLEQAMEKVKTGYTTIEGEKIKAKGKDYSIEDIVACLEKDTDLNSGDTGYKKDSIRALVSRFAGAKAWGIFDSTGTPLTELSRENQLTVIDTSFLDDNVTALVIGILARRILAARKVSTRKEAAKRMEVEKESKLLEFEIPPTWLFIDEAHLLIPSGNMKTPATEGLLEYVKQGRRPGCSLVFATQQPSAIDSRVLSQLDIIMTHKLVFNDDIKAVYKRTPAIIPHKYKAGAFIKTLPVGTALTGDRREETSRAFLLKFRPRMSQHEGREAETIEVKKTLDNEAVQRLIAGMYLNRLKRDNYFKVKELERILDSMNKKYSASVALEDIIKELKKNGALFKEKEGIIELPVEKEKPESPEEREEEIEEAEMEKEPEPKEIEQLKEKEMLKEAESLAKKAKTEEEPAPVSLLAFSQKISEEKARDIIKKKKFGFLGLLGKSHRISDLRLKHITVFKVKFNYFNEKNAFRPGTLFVNSQSGEFLHYKDNKFVESTGLKRLYGLSAEEISVLNVISTPKTAKEISRQAHMEEPKTLQTLKKLVEKGLAKPKKVKEKQAFALATEFELPFSPLHPLHDSIKEIPLVESEVLSKEEEHYSKKDVSELLKKIWKKIVVTSIEEIYWPAYEGIIEDRYGKKSRVLVDAVTGKILAF